MSDSWAPHGVHPLGAELVQKLYEAVLHERYHRCQAARDDTEDSNRNRTANSKHLSPDASLRRGIIIKGKNGHMVVARSPFHDEIQIEQPDVEPDESKIVRIRGENGEELFARAPIFGLGFHTFGREGFSHGPSINDSCLEMDTARRTELQPGLVQSRCKESVVLPPSPKPAKYEAESAEIKHKVPALAKRRKFSTAVMAKSPSPIGANTFSKATAAMRFHRGNGYQVRSLEEIGSGRIFLAEASRGTAKDTQDDTATSLCSKPAVLIASSDTDSTAPATLMAESSLCADLNPCFQQPSVVNIPDGQECPSTDLQTTGSNRELFTYIPFELARTDSGENLSCLRSKNSLEKSQASTRFSTDVENKTRLRSVELSFGSPRPANNGSRVAEVPSTEDISFAGKAPAASTPRSPADNEDCPPHLLAGEMPTSPSEPPVKVSSDVFPTSEVITYEEWKAIQERGLAAQPKEFEIFDATADDIPKRTYASSENEASHLTSSHSPIRGDLSTSHFPTTTQASIRERPPRSNHGNPIPASKSNHSPVRGGLPMNYHPPTVHTVADTGTASSGLVSRLSICDPPRDLDPAAPVSRPRTSGAKSRESCARGNATSAPSSPASPRMRLTTNTSPSKSGSSAAAPAPGPLSLVPRPPSSAAGSCLGSEWSMVAYSGASRVYQRKRRVSPILPIDDGSEMFGEQD